MNSKTKFIQLSVAVAAFLGFAACNPTSTMDERDAFVGVYSYQSTGKIDFYAGSKVILSKSLNEEGTLTISKKGDKDQVNIIGYNDTIQATVSGNTLTLEANEFDVENSGMVLHLNFVYDKATLKDDVLTWQSDVTGSATYMGITANGNGSVTTTATKLQK